MIFFERLYLIIYTFLTIASFLYKGYKLYYPRIALALECFFIFVIVVLQLVRYSYGNHSCRHESVGYNVWFLILSLLVTPMLVYFLLWQIYVIIVDFVVNIVALSFILLEFLFSLSALIAYAR
eukprot:TRINITY_DN1046_c0_g1_i2.p1 TRINITY_DN1046_c0_g1~~TRINITY_DN1046_c0_g1_i2.p1  ORF type:complete len:123 (-),score=5.63 TRINITY_DN1046_c0_g1_i2:44-412(-)